MSLEVEVTLEKIHCVSTGGDEYTGGLDHMDLEIRGGLGVSVGPAQNQPREVYTLFRRADNEGVKIFIGESYPIHISKRLLVHPNERVWIGGHLKEDDNPSADDDLGDHRHDFGYHFFDALRVMEPFNIPMPFWDRDNQRVDVFYQFKKVRNL